MRFPDVLAVRYVRLVPNPRVVRSSRNEGLIERSSNHDNRCRQHLLSHCFERLAVYWSMFRRQDLLSDLMEFLLSRKPF